MTIVPDYNDVVQGARSAARQMILELHDMSRLRKSDARPTALDLFSGAGGLSCAFEWNGGRVVGGIEIDPVAAATFQANHPEAKVWVEDIRGLDPEHVGELIESVDGILGGPMCQGVSQRGPRDPHDERNFAFWAFADFVRVLRPKWFLMENVPALVSDVHNRALAIAVFEEFETLGYQLSAEVLNAAWFGVPQLRYRLIVMGRLDCRPEFPHVAHDAIFEGTDEGSFTTVGEAITDLPRVRAGSGVPEMPMPPPSPTISRYALMMRKGAELLWNHWSAATDDVNLNRIRHVPEGGNWHDIPLDLLPSRFRQVRPSDHTTTYRRLDRQHPSYTITTECGNVTSGSFTHPTQNRAITVREAARLQGFPDRFRFVGPRGSQYRQVGNAVPPLMAKAVLESLLEPVSGKAFHGRLDLDLLKGYPRSRLPMTFAPRYRVLFGRSAGVVRNRFG